MVKRGSQTPPVNGVAKAGATLFARQDYVEEALRITGPYTQSDSPVYAYPILNNS